jgi:hypothetical protein
MALPQGFDPDNPMCPVCASRAFDNRLDKRTPKSPDFKCSNQFCDSGNGKPWAAWVAPPAGGRPPMRPPQPAAAAPRPVPAQNVAPMPPRQQVSIEEWLRITSDVAVGIAALFAGTVKANGWDVPAGVILTQVRSALATFWMSAERGLVKVAKDVPKPVPLRTAKQYKALLAAAGGKGDVARPAIAKLTMMIAEDAHLTADEKAELATFAGTVLEGVAAQAELDATEEGYI